MQASISTKNYLLRIEAYCASITDKKERLHHYVARISIPAFEALAIMSEAKFDETMRHAIKKDLKP